LRAQVFLREPRGDRHRRRRLGDRDPRADPAAHRGRGPPLAADRQQDRGSAGRAGHPGRAAHRGEIPGGARDPSRQPAQIALTVLRRAGRTSASMQGPEGVRMNLNLTGNHLEITPAIRDYVVAKLDRITRHFDHLIDVSVVLSVNKLRQKIEANLHIRGKDLHAESIEPDMYAAIDALVDKLDRMARKG